MNDPKRLSEGSGSDVERALLRAGRAGAPPGAKSRAMAVASGAMAASSLVAAGAAAEGTAAAAKVGSIVALKWIGVLSVASVGALTSAAMIRTTSEHASSKSVAVSGASTATAARGHDRLPILGGPPQSAPSASTALISTRPDPAPYEPSKVSRPVVTVVAPARVQSAPVPGEPGGAASSTLSAELATLDQARAALAAGDAPRSLGILDRYHARFPSGGMAPEAAVLRIEVLLKAGDRPAAQRAADAFLASSPTSPYAPRIQSLLSASNP